MSELLVRPPKNGNPRKRGKSVLTTPAAVAFHGVESNQTLISTKSGGASIGTR